MNALPLRSLLFLLSIIFFIPCAAAETTRTIESTPTRVTLFQRGAEVTRSASVQLRSGTQVITFANVPHSINADSLRLGGTSSNGVTVASLELRRKPLKEDFSPEVKTLDRKIEATEQQLQLMRTDRTRLERELKLVQEISLDTPHPRKSDDAVLVPRSPQDMAQLLKFIATESERLNTTIHQKGIAISTTEKELELLKKQRRELQPTSKYVTVVDAELRADAAVLANLELTYFISNASWQPAYTLTVEPGGAGSGFALDTYAVLQQASGEAWHDVAMTLSTAQPHIGLYRPTPSPIILDVERPMPRAPKAMRMESRTFGAAADGFSDMAQSSLAKPAAIAEEAALREDVAAVHSVGVITYVLPHKVTLQSGNNRERVKVAASRLEGTIVNVAVPKSVPHVFREATIENGSKTPLLPGPVNVFAYDNFVGKQHIPFTAVNKKITLPVGLSQDITVTRKLVERFEEDSGVVRSFRRIKNTYDIEIENHSDKPQQLVVLEPKPVSRNEQIKVVIANEEPKPLAKGEPTRVLDNDGIFEWHLTAAKRTKAKITYETVVEFKADIPVTGTGQL